MTKRAPLAILLLVVVLLIFACAVPVLPARAAEEDAFSLGALHVDYNRALMSSGALVYQIIYQYDFSKIVTDTEDAEALAAAKEVAGTLLDAAKSVYEAKGYAVTKGDSYITVTLANYSSYTQYYIASGVTGYDDPGENTGVRSFYYIQYESSFLTPFAELDADTAGIIAGLSAPLDIAAEAVTFGYNYGTKYRTRRIQTDADKQTYNAQQKVYWHTYYMTDETRLTRTVNIVQKVPNPLGWYLTVILAAVPLIVAAVIVYIKHQKKKAAEEAAGTEETAK